MKIFHITLASCLLLSALLAGCRNRPADTSVPSTAPSTAATTAPRQTMPSTPPATMPPVRPSTGPTVTMPSGTDVTPGTQDSEGALDPDMTRRHGDRRY